MVPAILVETSHLPEWCVIGHFACTVGAGTGLCSLAAIKSGAARVLATDYREEPLDLLRESAVRNGLVPPATAQFDITDQSAVLPDAEFTVAADLLYLRSTSVALARRCVEALRSPSCRACLVGDLGRPGRKAFLDELVAQGVRPEAAYFTTVQGWLPGAPRHELVSSANDSTEPQPVSVGLLRLAPKDLD